MLVSIILTCYKQEKFIEETMLSVINQKYVDRELLIGDDSPDDNCRKIISKYVIQYPDKIHAWHHYPNKWIVNNMQFLLDQRNKESEYVAFLEWDDCLSPEYLERKLEIFKNHPNVQLVYNELTTIDEKWETITKNKLKQSGNIICKKWKISYDDLINKDYYMSWSTLMVRSEILHKYHIYSDFLWSKTIISDVCFFNQVAHNEDIYWIWESIVYYRIHEDSVTKNIQGSTLYYFELMKYLHHVFELWLIWVRVYKNQVCKSCLLIAIPSLKMALNKWIIRTLKFFIIECIKAIKVRFRIKDS